MQIVSRAPRIDANAPATARAVAMASEKWLLFEDLATDESFPLDDRIAVFAFMTMEEIRARFPELESAPGDDLFLAIVRGVRYAGTHDADEIDAVLGMNLTEP